MINLLAPINKLSYGNVTTGLLYGLQQLNQSARLYPIQLSESYPEYASAIQQSLKNSEEIDINSPSVRIYHQFALAEHVGTPRIGFPIFELDKFTPREKSHINSCDRILVCSKWAKQIVESETTRKADVVPLGVNTNIFRPVNSPTRTIFLVTGKLEIRKGHDILAQLFSSAFEPNDDVELWFWVNNPFLNEKDVTNWKNYFTRTKMGPNIRFVPYLNSLQDVANLYNSVTAGICISRAEGWNLPLLELMACGRKNIVTNYSGHTEFCTNENSYLVNIDKMETAYDGYWFKNDLGNWAVLGKDQKDQIIEYMRLIHRNKPTIDQNCVKTGEKFTWQNMAQTLLSTI